MRALAAAASSARAQADAVYVTPLDRDEASIVQPASVLSGDALRRREAASLGDTLDREPGLHSAGMGRGASRLMIRGLDAPRVRVLEDGLGVMDVSSISPDHRIAAETIGATQVEILRGPATLIHGGGAIGGLVNVVTKRIPRERIERVVGVAELRAGGAGREVVGLLDLNGGSGGFAWHLDAFRRQAGDYRIRGAQNPNDPASPVGRVANSFVEAKGASVGARSSAAAATPVRRSQGSVRSTACPAASRRASTSQTPVPISPRKFKSPSRDSRAPGCASRSEATPTTRSSRRAGSPPAFATARPRRAWSSRIGRSGR
ncbi:MAG: TonB-dependent receptor plug domain-containing protein [Burkholderiales bacterium]|nr:TonB-dependent receptor plug domain-containing protein [Burkholderiales bacterium]